MKLRNYNIIPGKWSRYIIYLIAAVFIIPQIWKQVVGRTNNNGFELKESLVPITEIYKGGPPKDGIPAIDKPKFIKAKNTNFLKDHDRVLGVFRNGIAKAYPIKILNWHEIVNDHFDEEAVVVTYCPLCNSGMAFLAKVGNSSNTFGVSGLLYNSDVLLYDRQTESLWSQILGQAISGPMKGSLLAMLPCNHTTWKQWQNKYANTLVLSTSTGYLRNYERNPYQGYDQSKDLKFPVARIDQRYHPKELVIGLKLDDNVKVYPFVELARSTQPLHEIIGSKEIILEFDAANNTGKVLDGNGSEIPTVICYWFAWVAFHPDTEIFNATLNLTNQKASHK